MIGTYSLVSITLSLNIGFPVSSLKWLQTRSVFYPENGDYLLREGLRFACSIVGDELEDE